MQVLPGQPRVQWAMWFMVCVLRGGFSDGLFLNLNAVSFALSEPFCGDFEKLENIEPGFLEARALRAQRVFVCVGVCRRLSVCARDDVVERAVADRVTNLWKGRHYVATTCCWRGEARRRRHRRSG